MQSTKYVFTNAALEPPEVATGYGLVKHTLGLCNSAPQGLTYTYFLSSTYVPYYH
jgi:hypothetical protein